jgi:SET domain-containing protein
MPYTFQSETSDIVEVKKSKINKAGKGLFAKQAMKRGDHICLYFGVLVFKDQVHNGYYESDYMLEDPAHDFIIDAADPKSCLGRYANDSLSMKKSNCKFAFYDDPFSGYLQATKAIKKGEEIYVSYGKDYWQDAIDKDAKSYTSLPKKDKDFINLELL